MTGYHIAQLNIAQMLAPMDSPQLEGFVANLDRINGMADNAPGFVWRLQGEEGNATSVRDFGDDVLVNLSVWKNIDVLHDFVYGTAHREIMRQRKSWFQRMGQAHTVLWWIASTHHPTTNESKKRLDELRAHGATASAFTFGQRFPSPHSS